MPLKYSWVESANTANHPFPLNNLPYCSFKTPGGKMSCGIGIGDFVLNATALEESALLKISDELLLNEGDWTKVIQRDMHCWTDVRDQVTELLKIDATQKEHVKPLLKPVSEVELHIPFSINEYSDFYSGRNHAENVGRIFRGEGKALPPNWLYMPIGYCGRRSSIVHSTTPIVRPWGQIKHSSSESPVYEPSSRFDFELEMGTIVGRGTPSRVSVKEADELIFGYTLLNDWSARDIQAWEYQPLGPFLSKAVATSLSPWIITKEALEPFRVDAPPREVELFPHLKDNGPMFYDVNLSVDLAADDAPATTITQTNFKEMYFSSAQQIAHLTSSGCSAVAGDLLGSGTISGPNKNERGCLLELTWGGEEPLMLPSGIKRTFLEDGDTVTIRGHAQGDGYRIGFGECTGTIQPAEPAWL
ncbi:MAG: fumarylacetoacetase [Aestuariivita sp.]|nr:fumarylacetoacetase [Aestuariivita sp.]